MDAVAELREFNRFYTRQIGLLNEHLSHSDFSLAEARVLFELAHRAAPTAAELARDLDLDPAYLSRILKRFRAKGLIDARVSERHGKQRLLSLTEAGRAAFAPLDKAADAEVGSLLSALNAEGRTRLIGAARTMQTLLRRDPAPEPDFRLRIPVIGDLGLVVRRQAMLYAEEYGWDWTFEGLLAEIVAQFVQRFDPARERCWIAERHGAVAGSVFLVRGDEATTGKLRLLYVEPSARGRGLGRALVDACIAQARAFGYARLALWTNDILHSARRLYEAAGFTLVDAQPHHSFGQDLIGQNWVLPL